MPNAALDGITRVEAEFVVQNGEGGPMTFGLRVLLNSEDFHRYPIDGEESYFAKVVVPLMRNRFREDINEQIKSGRLWEGAYLVTHPDDTH